jgi:hypothetical protein
MRRALRKEPLLASFMKLGQAVKFTIPHYLFTLSGTDFIQLRD